MKEIRIKNGKKDIKYTINKNYGAGYVEVVEKEDEEIKRVEGVEIVKEKVYYYRAIPKAFTTNTLFEYLPTDISIHEFEDKLEDISEWFNDKYIDDAISEIEGFIQYGKKNMYTEEYLIEKAKSLLNVDNPKIYYPDFWENGYISVYGKEKKVKIGISQVEPVHIEGQGVVYVACDFYYDPSEISVEKILKKTDLRKKIRELLQYYEEIDGDFPLLKRIENSKMIEKAYERISAKLGILSKLEMFTEEGENI